MCPNAGYRIGHEKGAGKNGNAPILLYDFLPMELSFLAVALIMTAPFNLLIISPFTIYGVLKWLVISLAIIFTIQIVFQLILKHRYRIPYTSSELPQILSNANYRMGFSVDVELWLYPSIKPVLVPLSGLFFKALVISKPAEDDLLASPKMAELVLADHLESIDHGLLLSTWLPIASFVLLTSLFVRWTGLAPEQAVGISWVFFWAIVIFSANQLVFGKEDKGNAVLETYGTHSDVARCIVFRGAPPTEAEMKDISKKPIDPLSKDADRTKRYFPFFGALFVSLIIGALLSSWILNLEPTPSQMLNGFLIILPMLVSLSVFMGLFFHATRIKYEYPEQPLNQPVPKFDKT